MKILEFIGKNGLNLLQVNAAVLAVVQRWQLESQDEIFL